MLPVSIVGIFCEDIREEKSGQDVIVGTLPDNLSVAKTPGLMPKLSVYLRIHFDAGGMPPKSISVKMIDTDGTERPLPQWEPALIEQAFTDSRTNQMPIAGLISKITFSPYPVSSLGRILIVATIDGADHIAGALNVVPDASASPPPTLQSSSAS